jgi:hypothetical protein
MARELMQLPTVNRHLVPVENDHIRYPPDSERNTSKMQLTGSMGAFQVLLGTTHADGRAY